MLTQTFYNLDSQLEMPVSQQKLHITVGIASVGRSAVLKNAVSRLACQSRSADRVILSITKESDLERSSEDRCDFDVLIGERGLTRQRNAILETASNSDLVVFFDDDFVPADDYLERVEALFFTDPDVVLATGHVIADGINSEGVTLDAALDHIAQATSQPRPETTRLVYNGYGCNMALRMSPIRRYGIRFDVQLPLYGWLEDVDFSRALSPFGTIVQCSQMQGVHLGTKSGRQAGAKLGYSQISNPIYLVRKGTMRTSKAVWLMIRNICMNALRAFNPEPYVDRAGRLRGNAIGVRDLILRRLHPSRILDM